jgi:osmotically-inducible protein OsmY
MRRFCVLTASAICLLCLVLLTGEARGQGHGKQSLRTVPPKARSAGTRTPVLSDDALQRAIVRRFAQSKIGANGFSVSVNGGTATLSGVAQVSQHKGVATRLAKAAGAREVINRIEISPDARAKARARAKDTSRQPTRARQSVRGSALDAIAAETSVPPRSATPAPVESAVPAPADAGDSGKEPEAIDASQASKGVGGVKSFRILSGQSTGKPGAGGREAGTRPPRRRY